MQYDELGNTPRSTLHPIEKTRYCDVLRPMMERNVESQIRTDLA